MIGGGDWAKFRLVPDFMRAFLNGEAPIVRSPNAVRPWQHVLEPLAGYILLSERCWTDGAGFGEGWNFGPEQELLPVSWIADRLAALWGDGARWHLDHDKHPHEAAYLYLDITKAKTLLGYQPRWNIDAALSRTVEWFRSFGEGKDMAAVTLTQIAAFSADSALSDGARSPLPRG